MDDVQRFCTDMLPPATRLSAWNQIAEENWQGVSVTCGDGPFRGAIASLRCGDLHCAEVLSSRARVDRSSRQARSNRMTVHFQKRGSSLNLIGSSQLYLGEGDMIAFGAEDCYRIELSPGNSVMVLDIDGDALVRRMGAIKPARVISARCRPTRLVGALMGALLETPGALSDPLLPSMLEGQFMELLGLVLRDDANEGASAAQQALYSRALAIIDMRLRDPDLSTMALARELSLTERSVQLAFAVRGLTPSAVILGRRLDLAAAELRQAPHLSITDIAFGVGLSSSAYFARCFRERFGVSPRQFRKAGGFSTMTSPGINSVSPH